MVRRVKQISEGVFMTDETTARQRLIVLDMRMRVLDLRHRRAVPAVR